MDKKYSIESLAPRIEGFLAPTLGAAGLDLKFAAEGGEHLHPDVEDPEIIVKFSGRDVDVLLENRAELLLALELLTMEVLRMPPEDHSLLRFDANDYRALRIEELRLSALTAAENVKRTRRPFHFNPMSSRERRIIHLSLRNETDVKSQSTGAGPIRQVVIVPFEMETIPEPIRPAYPRAPRDEPRGRGPRDRGPGDRDRGRRR